MSIRRKREPKATDGASFVLHDSSDGQPFKMWIPFHEDWYWGTMEGWGNYVSNGKGIYFIKETYEEFWALRCDAYNKHYRLGKYMNW